MAKLVVITGASSGIGRSAALRFARSGWRVGLIARGASGLEETRRAVEAAGGSAAVAVADVTDTAALERAAGQIEAALGPIEVWVNNAGVGVFGTFLDIPDADFRQVIETNLIGAVNGTRVALHRMEGRRGVIVQIASLIAFRGVPLQTPYSASKYALRGFTEALRSELAGQGSGVRVCLVHPPAVNTPFYNHAKSFMPRPVRPPPPIYQPELVADAIYRAATTDVREIKVTEDTVAFALGNTLVPRLMDFAAGLIGIPAQQSNAGGAVAARDTNLDGAGRIAAAHGPFDRESLRWSPKEFVAEHAGAVALGAGLLALAVLSGRRS